MVALRRGGRRGRADTGYRACTSRCTRRHQHRENHRSRPAGHSDAAETTPPRSPHPRSYSSALSTPGNHRPTGAILGEHVHWIQVVSAVVAHGGVAMPDTAILLTSTPPSPDKDHHRSDGPKPTPPSPPSPQGSVPATLLAGPVSPGTHHGKLLASSTAFILRPPANHSPTASPPAMTICSPS